MHKENLYKDNILVDKIEQLEEYLKLEYPYQELKIHDFLRDIKEIKNNLSVIGILNYLVEMYGDGVSSKEIARNVKKTQKIFNIASEYITSTETDEMISSLSKEIHEIIVKHLEIALYFYKKEYNI